MKINIENILIDKNKVLKFLGYANRKVPNIIMKKVDEEIEKSYSLINPVAFIKSFKIDNIKEDTVYFGDSYSFKSEYLSKELKTSSSLYLAIYTIGNEIEEKINEHSNNSEMIRGMILDKIGVVALDNIRNKLKELILKEVEPFKISAQVFPEMKDFHISNQKIILEAFNDENNIITISKHYQLSPIRTVAVVFGIGNTEDDKSMCDRCENKCFLNN